MLPLEPHSSSIRADAAGQPASSNAAACRASRTRPNRSSPPMDGLRRRTGLRCGLWRPAGDLNFRIRRGGRDVPIPAPCPNGGPVPRGPSLRPAGARAARSYVARAWIWPATAFFSGSGSRYWNRSSARRCRSCCGRQDHMTGRTAHETRSSGAGTALNRRAAAWRTSSWWCLCRAKKRAWVTRCACARTRFQMNPVESNICAGNAVVQAGFAQHRIARDNCRYRE